MKTISHGGTKARKDLPILMCREMVRAVLRKVNPKRQTRRAIKDPTMFGCLTGDCPHEKQTECDKAIAEWASHNCPYGRIGDRLWVRETFRLSVANDCACYDQCSCNVGEPIYAATCGFEREQGDPPWKPSIFMPRKYSRILLEVTSVRVERLHDISEEDCLAEGVNKISHGRNGYAYSAFRNESAGDNWSYPDDAYQELWESINGKGFWDKNPWVWVIHFKRI